MKLEYFLNLLDEIVEARPGTLKGAENLSDVAGWDSLAVLSFIAMVDDHFKIQIPGKEISACGTVRELVSLLGDRIVP
jgi:acyl carrier protein